MLKGTLLAVVSAVLLVLIAAAPVLAAGGSALPPPVTPQASLDGSSVNLTWRAPTTSVGTINQTGCDSSFVMFTAINSSFSKEYPSIEIVLRGGGNNVAFSEWIAKHSDVAMASRKITADELQKAQAVGLNVTEIKIAVESITLVVDPGAKVTVLTAEQVKALFTGSVTNWKDVGGSDLAVKPFVPGPGGPPYLFFNNSLMAGSSFSSSVQFVKDSLTCADMVANHSGGIGIIRTGYLNRTSGVQAVSLRSSPDGPAYSPMDIQAAYNNTYRLARNYYLYTNGAPSGREGMWADYALSGDRGQKAAAENGFLPLNATDLAASHAIINGTSDIPVTGYKIYRTDSSGSNRTFSSSSTRFVDTNVTSGNAYTYHVSAIYAAGEGSKSAPLSVDIPASGSQSGSTTTPTAPSDNTLPIIMIIGAFAVITVVAVLRKRR
jgi:phosphate transport system substrate-binding protein